MGFNIWDWIPGASAVANWWSAKDTNRVNREIAREQMQFQERMSNTAFQRSVEDMKKAGINPILAFSQGGASTPPGASATMTNEMAPALQSALDYKRNKAEIENIQQQNKLNQALEASAKKDAEVKSASANQIRQRTVLEAKDLPTAIAQREASEIAISTAKALAAELNNQKNKYSKDVPSALSNLYNRYTKFVSDNIEPTVSAVHARVKNARRFDHPNMKVNPRRFVK
jgi:paraquat-inducible protein B